MRLPEGHRMGKSRSLLAVLSAALLVLPLLAGCNPGRAGGAAARIDNPDARYAREAQQIKADPVAYLRQLHTRCEALQQYRLVFYRQQLEGGLFGRMSKFEAMRATYRKHPFSVKFEWDAPEARLYELVYVEGQNNGKLIIRERHGFLFFPPQVRVLDPAEPVKLGFAKEPITDFGFDQLLKRTLRPFDDPRAAGHMSITCRGLVTLDPTGRAAHQIRLEHPPLEGLKYTRQDFYVDAETLLPAGTDVWTPEGQIAARFRYADVDINVALTDADFRLSKDHPATGP